MATNLQVDLALAAVPAELQVLLDLAQRVIHLLHPVAALVLRFNGAASDTRQVDSRCQAPVMTDSKPSCMQGRSSAQRLSEQFQYAMPLMAFQHHLQLADGV